MSDFQKRLARPWLADTDQAEQFAANFQRNIDRLGDSGTGPVVVMTDDRVAFLAGVLAAIAQGRAVFLFNAQWGETEVAEAMAQVPEGAFWLGESPREGHSSTTTPAEYAEYANGVMIPTGGTGGRVKFAVHTWESLTASVAGYREFWKADSLHAVCPLPVCHIGGLMLALRTWVTGGRLWLTDSKLETIPPSGFPLVQAHCSLVGAQLKRVLEAPGHWVGDCAEVLVGGGPSSGELVAHALALGLRLHVAYGLTEAAATVALARAGDSLVGSPEGAVLPHWKAAIREETIALAGPALFRGYWGQPPLAGDEWLSGDRGVITSSGRLRVLGRRDRVIITGGKKVDADELERRVADWPEVAEVVIWGESDATWGQRVTAAVVGQITTSELVELAREHLMPEMRPKHWHILDTIPRTMNGKVDWRSLFR
ncbi:MAG: AMP-binding protein, partial [Puniceicoccales bacterium]